MSLRVWAPTLMALGTLLWVGVGRLDPQLNDASTRRRLSFLLRAQDPKSVQSKLGRMVLASGDGYDIFTVGYGDPGAQAWGGYLLGSPGSIIAGLRDRLAWVAPMVASGDVPRTDEELDEAGRRAYLELVKSLVSGVSFHASEMSIHPGGGNMQASAFDPAARQGGEDWAWLGDTMTGWKRLDNVRDLIVLAIKENVPGDYIETGVWRGGSSILARAVLHAYGEADKRKSYVCDSFRGLPPGDRNGLKHSADKGWDSIPYLEVADEIVVENFRKFSLLDENVVFVKGFFSDSMPPLANEVMEPGAKLAVMRLDGDMYQSTVDVLYRLYDKLSVGGYVIIDDWFGFPAQDACQEFFKVHGISPQIIPIDNLAAYWRKEENVEVQKWRYEQSQFS